MAGAIAHAKARYPSLPASAVSNIGSKVYSQLDTIEAFFGGNLGSFANPIKHFGCGGDSIRFTTYSQFIDNQTGKLREFWTDTTITLTGGAISPSSLVWQLYNEGVLAAKQKGYDPKPLLPGSTATEMLAAGTLKITGYQCV